MKTSQYNGYKVNLVESIEDIKYVKSLMTKEINTGLDTETHSLTFAPEQVVGVCISCGKSYSKKDYQGFYLPIRHIFGNNLPIKEVYELVQYQIDNFKVVFWNRPFDNFMLEMDGIRIPFVGHTNDAQIMAHLAFSESYPALKDYAKALLGFDVISFSENEAKENDFGTTDPNISYVYAAQDPLVTVLLAKKLWMEYPYIRKVYPLDNVTGEAVRLMSKSQFYLDYSIIERELRVENSKLASIKAQIFGITGYEFKLDSNVDKADALGRFVTLTKKTKGGKFAVDAETLETIDHPLAQLFIEYGETKKYISSYLAKMLSWRDKNTELRVNYSSCNALSGRLSSGGGGKNDYYANLNIQNIPKEEVKGYIHRGGLCSYYVNDSTTEIIPEDLEVEGSVECKFTVPGVEIETDEGVFKLPLYTQVKVLREGKELCAFAKDLLETDELL